MTDIQALQRIAEPTVDVETAGRFLGIGRTTAYALAARNDFPCPVLRIGKQYRVPVAALRDLLGVASQLDD